jgi:hypothetical protein
MPRLTVAIFATFMLALSAAPARSIEAAAADDTARVLAGLQPSSNSPLTVLTNDPAWLSHARNLDSMFAREESVQLSKVREFSKKYLSDKHDTMLYMFSGPDFLYATSFFPNASTYVLAGLEPVGSVPDLTSLSPSVIDGELRSLEASMSSLFSFSFFITQKMKSQLREGEVYGTLPILYVFLARTSKTIHEVNFVSLDEQGKLVADELVATKRNAASGVKIVFSGGNGPKQTLYYFSTNLADGSFQRSGFSAFLARLGPADSLIKSASIFCTKRILPACGSSCSITARPSFRTIAAFRSPISKQRNGGFRRLGITLDRSQCSQISISPVWPSCFKVLVRSNSALDTDGARTSRTFSSPKAARG